MYELSLIHIEMGIRDRYKGGYFPVAPVDHFGDLRDQMVKHLQDAGLVIERAHHEVGTAGQSEIATRYGTLMEAADNIMKYKYCLLYTSRCV